MESIYATFDTIMDKLGLSCAARPRWRGEPQPPFKRENLQHSPGNRRCLSVKQIRGSFIDAYTQILQIFICKKAIQDSWKLGCDMKRTMGLI